MAKMRRDYDPEEIRYPDQKIVQSDLVHEMEDSYIEYAMSVIVGRALPDVRDGLKPVHRRILYAMYEDNLTSDQPFKKSATCVGDVLGRYHPHGDASVYDAMVRLAQNFSMRYLLVDGHGNFGSVDGDPPAAYRYTEARLSKMSNEMLRDIDKDTVNWDPNFDETRKEPHVLPSRFPNLLCNGSTGIAVGMATNIPPHNLCEVVDGCIALIDDPEIDLAGLMDYIKGPDFPTGGELIFDADAIRDIYNTGRGSVRVRAKYRYVKDQNLLEIYEIPYSTTVEAILDKVAELIKAGKAKEISDMRDETDLSGLKLAIDLKRGVDPDKLMAKLYKLTPLEDAFACNFNVLIAGSPKVLGIRQILEEWTAWRTDSVKRRIFFVLGKKKEKLHLLKGLKRILLDIDKAIRIIRETEEEAEVIPNLMIGFGIDQIQAEYVAEIKLRNINKEYILKRTQETDALRDEIDDLEDLLANPQRVKKVIVEELNAAAKKYGEPRRTSIVYAHEIAQYAPEEEQKEEYPVSVFLSREGYFKKITPASLRMNSEQKFKEGDALRQCFETTSNAEVMFFTDRCQVYKTRLGEFDDAKASVLGEYLPTKLKMDAGENVVFMVLPGPDYAGSLLFFFENGKAARVDIKAYQTTSNRRKLTGAYSDKSPLACIRRLDEDCELAVYSNEPRCLIFHTALLAPKTTRSTQGVAVMNLKPKYHLETVRLSEETSITNRTRYRVRAIPAAGALVKAEDSEDQQISLL